MEKRNVTVTLDKAREWFNSGNMSLKEIALQAFNKDELVYNFKNIKTFKGACEALNYDYIAANITARNIAVFSRASAAAFKLSIIRKALNLGQNLRFEDFKTYHPYNPIMTKDSTYFNDGIKANRIEIIGEIKSEGKEYYVLSGWADYSGSSVGLSCFYPNFKVGSGLINTGVLGCASKEIAEHFGKYFGMLITEAKYGDTIDFVIISDHYQKRPCISTK